MRLDARGLLLAAVFTAAPIGAFAQPTAQPSQDQKSQNDGQAPFSITRDAADQGKCDPATADARQPLSLNTAASHAALALCWRDAKNFARAIAEFDQAISLGQASGDAKLATYFFGRGTAKFDNRDVTGAIADLSEAVSREPGNAEYLTLRARAFRAARDYDLAISGFSKAIAIQPTAMRYIDRGLANALASNLDAALPDFDQALALDSTSPMAAIAYSDRGVTYLRRQDQDHAMADFNQSLALDSTSVAAAAAFANRGDLYRLRLDMDHALADLDTAVRLAPTNPSFLNSRCYTRALANREIDGAIADCDAALKLVPNQPNVLDSRGMAYFRKGALDQAIADYDLALRITPNYAVTLYHRGLAKKAKGDTEGGAADIAAALKLNAHAGDDMHKYGIAP